MEAVEFLKLRRRFCREHACTGCTVYHNCAPYANDTQIEQFVATIVQWAKEHPAKNRKSEFWLKEIEG